MNRIDRLRTDFESLAVDEFLVTDEINVRYLTGFTGDSSYLWVTPDRAVMLSDGRYTAQLAAECPTIEAAIRRPDVKMFEHVGAVLGNRPARTGIEAEHLSLAVFDQLSSVLDRPWVETSGAIASLRMIKDDSEILLTRQAIAIAEESFLAVGFDLGNPRSVDLMGTERELAFALENEMRMRGATGASFAPIIAVDENGALPHYRPSDRRLAGCQTLLVDWGAKYQGYASDLTRTLHRGNPTREFAKAYAACLRAHDAAVAAIAPGRLAHEIDAAARNVLMDAGFGDAFKHATGHGVGLEIHEMPRLGGKIETVLAAGMIVTVEPGVYLDGRFGIRIENDILVTPGGAELLSVQLPTGLEQNALIR
jgi:Xaa-Pro aminopeptidase